MALFQKYFAALFLAALLPDSASLVERLRKIPNVRVMEIGRTGLEKPMYAALIGKPGAGATYRWEQFTPEESGKVLARAEVLAATPSRMVTVLIPCTNPDGLDLLAKWQRQNLGSRYEGAPYPGLLQKYSDEPDDVMQNRIESRNLAALKRQFGIEPALAPVRYFIPDSPLVMDLLQRFAANGAKILRAGDSKGYLVQGGTRLVEMQIPALMGAETKRYEGVFAGEPVSDFGSGFSLPVAPQTNQPRIGVYEPWLNNPDTGWTEWLLDAYKLPYTAIHNEDFRKDDLDELFETVILSSQPPASIMHGDRAVIQRPEYAGGITLDGAAHLEHFVKRGGTLVALGEAISLPVEQFGLPVRLFPLKTDFGQLTPNGANTVTAVTTGGYAIEGGRATATLADGRAGVTVVDWGKGHVVLFGIRPQYRGQTFATFPLMLHAIIPGAERALR